MFEGRARFGWRGRGSHRCFRVMSGRDPANLQVRVAGAGLCRCPFIAKQRTGTDGVRCQVSRASLVAAYSSIFAMCCGVRRSLEAVSARSIPACFALRTLRSSGRRFGGELVVGATFCGSRVGLGKLVQSRIRLMWPGLRRKRQAISLIGMPVLWSRRTVRGSGRCSLVFIMLSPCGSLVSSARAYGVGVAGGACWLARVIRFRSRLGRSRRHGCKCSAFGLSQPAEALQLRWSIREPYVFYVRL